MKRFFTHLTVFEPNEDLGRRIMRRIRREATLASYQRALYTVLGISLVSSALTGYRLWQVVIDRSVAGFYQNLVHYLAADGLHPRVIWDLGMTFRQFFPLVEVGLFMLNVAGFVYLMKKALGVRREVAVSPVSVNV